MKSIDNYFIGTVTATWKEGNQLLKDYGEKSKVILVDIPGVMQNLVAYPRSTELDEAKVGDPVLILNLDPEYKTYFLYEKLKENDFIGFRSSGKMVSITPDHITVGVFDKNKNYKDEEEPECTAKLTVNSDGSIVIHCTKSISIETDVEDTKMSIEDGETMTLSASNITIASNNSQRATESGGAVINTNGMPKGATGTGAFCAIPYCPFTGMPHLTPNFNVT